jgi:hypothetical protein
MNLHGIKLEYFLYKESMRLLNFESFSKSLKVEIDAPRQMKTNKNIVRFAASFDLL